MKANFLTLKKHLASLRPRFHSAPADQVMRSWAIRLHSCEEVPEIYRDFFASLSIEPDAFPYTVLTPTYEGFFVRTNPKMVCLVGSDIYVVEHRRKGLEVACFPLADINYIEAGTMLLKSWLKISGVTQTGLAASSFQFSTVTQPFLDPLVEAARMITPPFASTDFEAERAKFYYLLKLHFKFMNYARRSVLPGEQVINSLLQPEIRAKVLTLFDKTFCRIITPAHISILTDRELILITEDTERLTDIGAPYGGIWRYIPLRKIAAVSLCERDERTLTLSIQMPQNDQVSSIFAAEHRAEADTFVCRLTELIS